MKLTGKKILVTGGAGFIGSNLSKQLTLLNNEVSCLDNLLTGHRSNISELEHLNNFTFIKGDICDFETCMEVTTNIDIIFHQAALGSVPRSINNPIATNNNNVTGFLNLLTAAKENNVKRFIYAASSSTYGDSNSLPKVEDVIGKPLSPYAVTKYVNELYADVFSKTYGIETIGLRYFNVFGPNQDPNGAYAAVIPKFIQLFTKGESPTINGDGSFSRDFTYIENVVQANILAATTNNPEALNTVFNVAYGGRTTLLELTNGLKQALTPYYPIVEKTEIKFGPERQGDIPHSLASIDKARLLLSYKPQVSLEEGLQKLAKWWSEKEKEIVI